MKYYSIAGLVFLTVALGSFVSRHFGWYNSYWYTDIILHTLSGIGFGFIWAEIEKGTSSRFAFFCGAVSFATFGSVLWEFWEFGGWKVIGRLVPFYIPVLSDTLGDIVCGLCGGTLAATAILLFLRKPY